MANPQVPSNLWELGHHPGPHVDALGISVPFDDAMSFGFVVAIILLVAITDKRNWPISIAVLVLNSVMFSALFRAMTEASGLDGWAFDDDGALRVSDLIHPSLILVVAIGFSAGLGMRWAIRTFAVNYRKAAK